MNPNRWFPRKMFYRVLWPASISALALSFADIADALVVGQRVGEQGLAAIGIVTPIYMIYNLFGYGIARGGCVTHGKLTAGGKNETALCVFRSLAWKALLGALLFAVLGNVFMRPLLALLGVNDTRKELLSLCESYARPLVGAAPLFMLNFLLYDFTRCDDEPGLATLGLTLGSAVDLGLNIFFVLILGKGVAGSVWATVTAQIVCAAVLSVHLFDHSGVLHLKSILRARGEPAQVLSLCLESLGIGFSTSVRYVFQFLFLFIANRLLLAAGDRGIIDGSLYVAVFDVVMNVSHVAYSIYRASAETMQPLASTFSEEHDESSLKYALRLALFWGVGLGAFLSAVLALLAVPISGVFGLRDSASVLISVPAIRWFCLSTPIAGALFILIAYYQSSGCAKLSSLITLLRSAVFLLPFTVLFGLLFPKSFWLLFPATEAASLLAFLAIRFLFERGNVQRRLPLFSAVLNNADHELHQVLVRLDAFCRAQEIPLKKAMQIQLAVEELCLVTMERAFSGKNDEYIQITLALEESGDCTLCIRNSAPRFNPLMMNMGKLQKGREEEFLDSVGVLMVKKTAKSFTYRNYEGFNVMRVVL